MRPTVASADFCTAHPWSMPGKRRYGNVDTYWRASAWLSACASVADWGGGGGFFRSFLPATVAYTLVDGTRQVDLPGQVLVDLAIYREPSDGILLRHVVDNTPAWQAVLHNALSAFRLRLAIVTYTPDVPDTHIACYQHGWPVWHFNHADLTREMGPLLVSQDHVGDERIYYLERR